MVRKKNMNKMLGVAMWLSRTLVGLGVGFSAITNTLVIPSVPAGLMAFAGYVVVASTIWEAGNVVMEAR